MPRHFFSAALTVAALSATPALAHVQLIQIAMSNAACTPDRLDFVAGSPVLLQFVSTSDTGHGFDAPELFAAGTLAPEDRTKVVHGAVEVGRGETVELRFTPLKKGTYTVQCSHFPRETTGTAVIE